jgi:secreted trypsin-like serine protease
MEIKKILGISLTVGLLAACGAEGVKNNLGDVTKQKSDIMNGARVEKDWEQPTYQSTVALTTRKFMDKGKSFCTGTVIHPRVVMTAAHCVVDKDGKPVVDDEVLVAFGKRVNNGAPTSAVLRQVAHPRFDIDQAVNNEPDAIPNDIALLLIDGLPSRDFHPTPILNEEVTPWSDVIAAGYGVTANGLLKNDSGKLREVRIKVSGTDPENKRFTASGFFKGTCSGDSGGPIYLKRNGRWVVTGVTSAGPQLLGTCLGTSVFTNASQYRGWIRRVMKNQFGISTGGNPAPRPRPLPNPVPRLDKVMYIDCASRDMKYSTCDTGIDLTYAVVGVKERHSRARCELGNTFGQKKTKIWVDRGCRATFEIRYN